MNYPRLASFVDLLHRHVHNAPIKDEPKRKDPDSSSSRGHSSIAARRRREALEDWDQRLVMPSFAPK